MSGISKTPESLSNTINRLNQTFAQAEQVCSDEVVEFLEEKQGVIRSISESSETKDIIIDGEVLLSRAQVINLQMMVDDYKEVREVLLETTRNGRKILDNLTLSLMDGDDESRADDISAYSSLVSTINQSVKILASSYKDISSVLLNLDKLDKPSPKNLTINGDVNLNTQNTQNNQIISTTDLIKKLRSF